MHDINYLVIGGNGRTGRLAVDLLLERGDRVTVAARHPRDVPHPATATLLDLAQPLPPALLDGVTGVIVSVEPPTDTAGADGVMHEGVAQLADAAAHSGTHVVLVSQIYITRAHEHPSLAGIITARAKGEEALRASGASYTIVRPGWLIDKPSAGVRAEQGDTGDGSTSRALVAAAAVAALTEPAARSMTFELFDAPGTAPAWPALFGALSPDHQ